MIDGEKKLYVEDAAVLADGDNRFGFTRCAESVCQYSNVCTMRRPT